MKKLLRLSSSLAFIFFSLNAWSDFTVPPLQNPVVDQAGIISQGVEEELNRILKSLWSSGGSQVAVLTLKDLSGFPIEQASIKVVDNWKLGTAKNDNGVLLLVAQKERAIRIEVGQGLEGSLTDAYSKRILDQVIIPYLKQGDSDEAIRSGVFAILQITDPQFSSGGLPARVVSHRNIPIKFPGFFIFLVVLVIIINLMGGGGGRRFYRRHSRNSWGGFGGGSFGGFGGGGGGFGGGGGGFSGGGASGRW